MAQQRGIESAHSHASHQHGGECVMLATERKICCWCFYDIIIGSHRSCIIALGTVSHWRPRVSNSSFDLVASYNDHGWRWKKTVTAHWRPRTSQDMFPARKQTIRANCLAFSGCAHSLQGLLQGKSKVGKKKVRFGVSLLLVSAMFSHSHSRGDDRVLPCSGCNVTRVSNCDRSRRIPRFHPCS